MTAECSTGTTSTGGSSGGGGGSIVLQNKTNQTQKNVTMALPQNRTDNRTNTTIIPESKIVPEDNRTTLTPESEKNNHPWWYLFCGKASTALNYVVVLGNKNA